MTSTYECTLPNQAPHTRGETLGMKLPKIMFGHAGDINLAVYGWEGYDKTKGDEYSRPALENYRAFADKAMRENAPMLIENEGDMGLRFDIYKYDRKTWDERLAKQVAVAADLHDHFPALRFGSATSCPEAAAVNIEAMSDAVLYNEFLSCLAIEESRLARYYSFSAMYLYWVGDLTQWLRMVSFARRIIAGRGYRSREVIGLMNPWPTSTVTLQNPAQFGVCAKAIRSSNWSVGLWAPGGPEVNKTAYDPAPYYKAVTT